MKIYQLRYAFENHEMNSINDESMKVLDEIFDLLESRIERETDEMWYMWIKTERGTFEEYEKSEDYADDATSEKEYREKYDDVSLWLPLCAVKNEYAKLLRINKFTICIQKNPFKKDSYKFDLKKYLTVVKSAIEETIAVLECGTYNDMVKEELPYALRYGTINRKVFWQYYPKDKKFSLDGLSEKEISDFLVVLEKEGDNFIPDNPIKGMTFNKYFDVAYECFKSLGYKVDRDIFRTFQGYGEDFGGDLFKCIDFNSADDFDGVFDERIVGGGGHPWGLVRGSSRSRVNLYPQKAEGGYIFRLSGNPNWSVMEMVKCYLTLKRLNFPVYFSCPQATIKYLKEEDLVGFVPVTRMPVYCQCEFEEHVEDFRQYWESDYGKIKDLIKWQEIKEVKLKQ